MRIPKRLIEEDMEQLPFVKWDRFTVDETLKKVEVFGWIERRDSHEDFILLQYRQNNGSWDFEFATSSAEHTKTIFEKLQCTGKHNDCKRVEEHFKNKKLHQTQWVN